MDIRIPNWLPEGVRTFITSELEGDSTEPGLAERHRVAAALEDTAQIDLCDKHFKALKRLTDERMKPAYDALGTELSAVQWQVLAAAIYLAHTDYEKVKDRSQRFEALNEDIAKLAAQLGKRVEQAERLHSNWPGENVGRHLRRRFGRPSTIRQALAELQHAAEQYCHSEGVMADAALAGRMSQKTAFIRAAAKALEELLAADGLTITADIRRVIADATTVALDLEEEVRTSEVTQALRSQRCI